MSKTEPTMPRDVQDAFVALYKTHRQMAEEAAVQSREPGAGKRTRESRAADTDTCHGESGGEGESDDDEEDDEEVDGSDARRTVPRNPYEDDRRREEDTAAGTNRRSAHAKMPTLHAKKLTRSQGKGPPESLGRALEDAARSYNVPLQHVALCIYAKLPAESTGSFPGCVVVCCRFRLSCSDQGLGFAI